MRTTLFICYSHIDRKFRNELTTQLQPCSDAVQVWSDQSIPPGVEWLPEIDRVLKAADAAVIVVSPELLASKFITTHELPRMMRRHQADGMRPLWIRYRPALYDRTPLAAFQCLHDPTRPLSTLRKPIREQLLVDIVKRLCEPPPQRLVANVMRAADDVFTAEHHTVPSVTAQVRPDRIDMKLAGGRTVLFVTAAELERRLGRSELSVLRTHERAMDALLRRWARLYPLVTAARATPDPRDVRELAHVREALAKEFDAALGVIENLGYGLDDHYQAVRHVVASRDPHPPRGRSDPTLKPTISARFVVDQKGRPQWSSGENGYWLQAWIDDAPDKTASVVWRMHSSITPARETVATRPEYRKDFVAHGDFSLTADLRTTRRGLIRSLKRPLIEALEAQYPGRRSKPLRQAVADIEQH